MSSVRRRWNFDPIMVWNAWVKDGFRGPLGRERVDSAARDGFSTGLDERVDLRVGRGRKDVECRFVSSLGSSRRLSDARVCLEVGITTSYVLGEDTLIELRIEEGE